MPGGSTQERINTSLSHADTLLPRFILTAVWIGFMINISTNTRPVRASGPTTGRACSITATMTPVATAKIAGIVPVRINKAHQIAASTGSAFGSTAKNCHSCLARNRLSTNTTLTPAADIGVGGAAMEERYGSEVLRP